MTTTALSSLERVGYMESTESPRAGGVVRLELETSAELAWAKEKGCRWDTWMCARAAQGEHLGYGGRESTAARGTGRRAERR